MTKTRVVLVDDHEVVRLGLRTLLDDQPDLQVVGEAGTSAEAVAAVERLRPDIVLMDIRIPGKGGIETTQEITTRFAETKVIMLTSFADDELIWRAVNAGALGYVLKQVGNEELLRAIDAVKRGEALLDPATTRKMLRHVRDVERRGDEEAFRILSEREIAVLAEIAHGKTNDQIATKLNLTEKSIRNYVSKLLDKLRLNNRIELATFAMEHHLMDRLNKPPEESIDRES
jgi:two-component system, NarL family, response regulator DevR